MGFRWPLLTLFLLVNGFAYLALRRTVSHWVRDGVRRRRAMLGLHLGFLLLNLPLIPFFIRRLNLALLHIPTGVLEIVFYPSTAWLATIIAFFLLLGPLALIWGLVNVGRILWGWRHPGTEPGNPSDGVELSRRGFLAGSVGLLLPGIYAVAAYGTYGNLDDLDISAERAIPMPNLPRSLEGLSIVQITDLHVGSYIRDRELRRIVDLVNSLRPDVVVVTGDILDWDLSSLPDAVSGLRGIQSPLGIFAVLGNHDIYADQYSFTKEHRGGVEIVKAMETIGIRTLRNEVVELGEGQDRLALMGLDWLNVNPSSPNFYRYQQAETRRLLRLMSEQIAPERPKVLLAHHPDTFGDAIPFGIDLTLSGHTHGGGQVLLGTWNGVPLGIAMLRFKYLSGLYQERGLSLYVNRGIGYLGVPIRINCPPEISRFRLTRTASS
ncbi:MAG: metallophosphoesterase [Acidobacteria bacterium]|nr:metallophosphoesterase [Acidobacteriota bacterium]